MSGAPFIASGIFASILPVMVYERLQVVRAAVLVLGGFTALCVAAFLWSLIAGWVAVGLSLLVIEFLTGGESGQALDARGRGRG